MEPRHEEETGDTGGGDMYNVHFSGVYTPYIMQSTEYIMQSTEYKSVKLRKLQDICKDAISIDVMMTHDKIIPDLLLYFITMSPLLPSRTVYWDTNRV